MKAFKFDKLKILHRPGRLLASAVQYFKEWIVFLFTYPLYRGISEASRHVNTFAGEGRYNVSQTNCHISSYFIYVPVRSTMQSVNARNNIRSASWLIDKHHPNHYLSLAELEPTDVACSELLITSQSNAGAIIHRTRHKNYRCSPNVQSRWTILETALTVTASEETLGRVDAGSFLSPVSYCIAKYRRCSLKIITVLRNKSWKKGSD